IAEPEVVVIAEVFAAAEEQPTRFPEQRVTTLPLQATGFLGPDVVERLVHIGDDMEAIGNMQGLRTVLSGELPIRYRHVRANEGDLGNDLLAHGGEEALEGFDGPLLAHPEQAGDADIDLVDQGQVLVAFGVLNLIYADGVDLSESTVHQTPGDHMFDGVKDLFPGSAERLGPFFPRKPAH